MATTWTWRWRGVLQQRLEAPGQSIDTWQLHGLWHQCRMAKEKLFESPETQKQPVTLLGKGTKLIGGTIKTELVREDLDQVLVEGFFPKVASSEMPARQRRVGFQELGLPYAADAAITKHLARFLSEQVCNSPEAASIRRGSSGLACPTHVLFNGGVMKAAVLRDRLVEVLNGWLRQEGFDALGAEQILEAPDLEHAVARGAAYYGRARRGHGVRIRSGASRTYYIGIESAMPAVPGMEAPLKALCVVPFGMEEGTEATIPNREFGLVVGEPAEFRFLSSSVRKQDQVGSLLEDWGGEIEELSPLEVTLNLDGQQGAVVPVRLETRVTELGTLEVWCVSRDGAQRWKLELNIREKRPGGEIAGGLPLSDRHRPGHDKLGRGIHRYARSRRCGLRHSCLRRAAVGGARGSSHASALPSFLYFPTQDELSAGAVSATWDEDPPMVTGLLAREQGALVPSRQVSSAKSWLSYPGVNRRAKILPAQAEAPQPMISPVEASTRYLMHLRDAWNGAIGTDAETRFEHQEIVLTVPASFDEEARELTVEAARTARIRQAHSAGRAAGRVLRVD